VLCCGVETGEEQERGDADTCARPGLKGFTQIQMDSNMIQMISNLFKLYLIKTGHSRCQKIEIKYDFEGFEERNNFLHRDFFRFELDFE
jgi:hypothetical protein